MDTLLDGNSAITSLRLFSNSRATTPFREVIEWQTSLLRCLCSGNNTVILAASLVAQVMFKSVFCMGKNRHLSAVACGYIAQELTEMCPSTSEEWCNVSGNIFRAEELAAAVVNVLRELQGDVLLRTSFGCLRAACLADPNRITPTIQRLAEEVICLCLPSSEFHVICPERMVEGAVALILKDNAPKEYSITSICADLVHILSAGAEVSTISATLAFILKNHQRHPSFFERVGELSQYPYPHVTEDDTRPRLESSIFVPLQAKSVAEGTFAHVCKVEDARGVMVAVKLSKEDTIRPTVLEIAVMARLSHRNVQGMRGFNFRKNSTIYFWMDLALESLQSAIYQGRSTYSSSHRDTWLYNMPGNFQTITKKLQLGYASQIASALTHMHSMGIIHCDLKPANVLLYPEGIVKVCDFGICIPYKEGKRDLETTNFDVCTSTHRDINLLVPHPKGYSFEVDVWSLGIMMVEMATGCNPLYEIDSRQDGKFLAEVETLLYAKFGSTGFSDKTLLCIRNDHLRMIIKRCLDYNRETRISAQELRDTLETML